MNAVRLLMGLGLAVGLAGCTSHDPAPTVVYKNELPAESAPPIIYAPAPVQAVPGPAPAPSAFPGYTAPEANGTTAIVSAFPAPVAVQPQPVVQQPQVIQQPVVVQSAPPAPIVEPVPVSPGVEFVWTPGYWSWNGGWVWISGRWMHPPRPHAAWVQGHWRHYGHGWRWEGGHWR